MSVIRVRSQSGFSLIELLVATGLLLVISSIVTGAIMQMTKSQTTIFNRTEMHSGIRGATELLQQEVGQAGLISLPPPPAPAVQVTAANVTGVLPYANAVDACTPRDVALNSVSGMWKDSSPAAKDGIKLTFLGTDAETVRVTNIVGNTITACFRYDHAGSTPVMALGGFPEGIIPPAATPYTNGSTANRLKLFGDVNSDGSLVYVEYYCDNGDPGTDGSHNLYRNMMSFDAAGKPALTNSNILLSNVYRNPRDVDGAERPCFKYQQETIINTLNADDSHTYVLDVAITLTVQTQLLDPVTRKYQTETKALLNVSPRNVFNTWLLAGSTLWDRVQPTPPSVKALLPNP